LGWSCGVEAMRWAFLLCGVLLLAAPAHAASVLTDCMSMQVILKFES